MAVLSFGTSHFAGVRCDPPVTRPGPAWDPKGVLLNTSSLKYVFKHTYVSVFARLLKTRLHILQSRVRLMAIVP